MDVSKRCLCTNITIIILSITPPFQAYPACRPNTRLDHSTTFFKCNQMR
ncbi:hypothetical protein E2C01_075841 [Portunus trituberculatus]|uniref:Uncharacterized protein n=1 Tax=Portunus trituberculatus TaxID=210409 RepID=A0A5B7ILK8_PORTR|nr:hypothetical protein [Portunus trituberculatus]